MTLLGAYAKRGLGSGGKVTDQNLLHGWVTSDITLMISLWGLAWSERFLLGELTSLRFGAGAPTRCLPVEVDSSDVIVHHRVAIDGVRGWARQVLRISVTGCPLVIRE
ncbi:MAG: hypothetical protein ACRDWT_12255 [Jatrophihabitantaceae bacterium]